MLDVKVATSLMIFAKKILVIVGTTLSLLVVVLLRLWQEVRIL